MSEEEKKLLLKDLCGRVPYNIIVAHRLNINNVRGIMADIDRFGNAYVMHFGVQKIKDIMPFLRPLSSMTEEEKETYKNFFISREVDGFDFDIPNYDAVDWLLEHYFDFRGLLEKGLALPAPSDMYNIK